MTLTQTNNTILVKEIITDIAFTAGNMQAKGLIEINDSRELVNNISLWADEFMVIHDKTDWEKILYIEAVDDFASLKLLSNYGDDNDH